MDESWPQSQFPTQNGRLESDYKHVIKPLRDDGWQLLREPPDWVESSISDSLKTNIGVRYRCEIHHGDTFVYKAASGVHGHAYYVFRQLKSDYHDTNRHEGTCPNCQSYVRRLNDDYFLTCHRCGWQYRTPPDMLRYAIDRLLGRTD